MSKATVTRNNYGLSNEQILRYCPSVFADEKHESRSERYAYISTIEILNSLRHEGFIPTMAMQSGSRIEGKAEFTKHLLRLRQINELGNERSDTHEIVLVNSHDGTSAYQLMSGVFRTVCTNGLITGDIDANHKVYHKGNIKDDIIDVAFEIIDESKDIMEKIDTMKSIQLSQPERLLLANYSMMAKYDEEEETPFPAEKLLNPRRFEDIKKDLYTTFNVIQENMIKGGVRTIDKNLKRKTTRAVKSIDNNLKLNKLLWAFTNEMMKIKNAGTIGAEADVLDNQSLLNQ